MARKVLVADDSVTIQKVVGLTFANEDIELSFVDNGEEAISIARKLKPDLIMADVLMPGRSGYEVCEFVKTDPDLQHTPVLLLTGTFEPFDADRCAQVRADGTITKPFESQTLIRQVRELLDRPRGRAAAPAAPPPAAAPEASAVAAGTTPAPEETPILGRGREGSIDPNIESDHFDANLEGSLDADFGEEIQTDLVEEVGAEEEIGIAAGDGEADVPQAPDAYEFNADPESALRRETIDAPQTPAEGAPGGWSAAPSPEEEAPPASAVPQDEDVWDLSDFEAIDEAQTAAATPQAPEEEPETLWNEAAAEAIDIVESTSLDGDGDAGAGQAAAAGETGGMEGEPGPDRRNTAIDADDRFAEIAGESEFDEFDLSTGDDASRNTEESVTLETTGAVAPEGPVSEGAGLDADAEPLDQVVADDGGVIEALTLEEIPEDEGVTATADQAPPAAAPATPGEPAGTLSALQSDASAAIVRNAVRDAVEKVTWEAFSDLSETVVRAVQEKVEKIAWEVIPQMAETIIKEEIRKLKEGNE